MMQKGIIVETARDKMPTINHFSCYSINSLRYVRMRGETKQERDREREKKREQRNPVVFPLSFIPTINLDGHLADVLADLAEKNL